jgi:aminoglycoside 3-N-acetyltransferase
MKSSFKNDLSLRWEKSGVKNGDTILLHLDASRLLREFKSKKVKIDLGVIIDSFLDLLGMNGTLIMPCFNFDFANGLLFDINKTKSKMGILTEYFRNNYDIIRTGHPIYSFSVFGFYKYKFKNINNYSGYGEDSPFGILRKLCGKIAVLDLDDQHSMTFYHHIEEVNKVEWRYHKVFEGQYIDIKNEKSIKKYSLFVRRTDKGIQTNVNPAGQLMWKEGLYIGDLPKIGSGLRTVNAQDMFNFITNIIKKNTAKNILYRVNL